ncbi:suppressor of SWI4 1 homolog [Carcharodon carcharias]|uniref:suppressor of SWI4 1 homolog n=1 Tax=Carcharodon carcharias TaxID=13397 RepID=UPI001B7DC536|nr:suppressor of SWI4 1 homolog [Carcharodon carcharias]
MGKSERTKNQKKARANAIHLAQEEFVNVPHSFVFNRGQVGQNVHQLITDMRRLMEPFTARALKVRKKNLLKDFVAVAGPLGVTHFLIFTKSSTCVNFKMARLPRGPTLSFKVHQYSLVKDVISSLKRHRMHEQQFNHHPLLVLNNFGGDGMHIKLIATMFQNMFPSINVYKVGLNAIKRCVLISYNPDTHMIDIRHYSIKVVPVGMSRGMKKLLQEKFPNMSRFEDISELLIKGANLSESEAEQDGDHNVTELPQVYAGRGNLKAQQSAIRLTEIGPRMTLELVKIEEGMCDGQVMYHAFVQKTEDEVQKMLQQREKRLKLKEMRQKKQEGDIQRKREERELHKKKSLAGMKRKKLQDNDAEGDLEAEDPCTEERTQSDQSDADSDREYYRQEVGVEPDDDLFPAASHRKRKRGKSPQSVRKQKRAKGPDKADSKKHTSQYSDRKSKKSSRGRKTRLVGTRLVNSKLKGSVLGSKAVFKGKGHRGLGSKDKGQSKGKGQRPSAKGKAKYQRRPRRERCFKQEWRSRSWSRSLIAEPGQLKENTFLLKEERVGAALILDCWRRVKMTEGVNTRPNNASFAEIQRALLPPVFGIEFIWASFINSLAIWLFLSRAKHWHAGLTYAFCLALNDLLYVTTLPLLVIYYANNKDWIFGKGFCKIERFLFTCNLYGSMFLIACISLNRYLAIVHPMFSRNHAQTKYAKIVSLTVWFLAIAITSPTLYFSTVSVNGTKTECLGSSSDELLPVYFPYSLFLAVFGCAFPFAVTLLSYMCIFREIRSSQSVNRSERRQVALLVCVVIVLYTISFIPYTLLRNLNMYRRLHRLDGEKNPSPSPIYIGYQVSKCLLTLSMCIHPLLYASLFQRLRSMCMSCAQQKLPTEESRC